MKISVSLPPAEVEFLDTYAHDHGVPSRSAALSRAVALLQQTQLEAAYQAAWEEWDESGEADLWESTVADGLGR